MNRSVSNTEGRSLVLYHKVLFSSLPHWMLTAYEWSYRYDAHSNLWVIQSRENMSTLGDRAKWVPEQNKL